MFIFKGNWCMDGRWSISHCCLGVAQGVLGGQRFFKMPRPSLSLAHLSFTCLTPSICPGEKVQLSILTSACADARDQMFTSGSYTEPHPNSSLILFLRLTSASALLLWHFLGANSKLNDLIDWNTELKMGRPFLQPLHITFFLPFKWLILLQLPR